MWYSVVEKENEARPPERDTGQCALQARQQDCDERVASTMSNAFEFLSHEDQLTDELFAFVTDRSAEHRNQRPLISVLHETLPQMVTVAECMILDGVEERTYVADYVHAVLHGEVGE